MAVEDWRSLSPTDRAGCRRLRLRRHYARTAHSKSDAGVLVVLSKMNEEWSVLLTVRSLELRRHPGEVCFPGGMRDKSDESLVHTALREAKEEIGLDATDVRILGVLPPFMSRFGVLVHPTVAMTTRPQDEIIFDINEQEVARVFWTPLATFLSSENHSSLQFLPNYILHFFQIEPDTVFGLTALIAIVVAMCWLDQLPDFDLMPYAKQSRMRGRKPERIAIDVYERVGRPNTFQAEDSPPSSQKSKL